MISEMLGEVDLFISLVPWDSEDLHILWSRLSALSSIGFASYFAVSIALDYQMPSTRLVFRAAEQLKEGLSIEDYSHPIRYGEAMHGEVASLLDLLPEGCRIICVHSETTGEKEWEDRKWLQVIRHILAGAKHNVLFLLGVAPQLANDLQDESRVYSIASTSLEFSCTLLSKAFVFLGVDSCFMHAADLARVPSVVLFGATDPWEFGPSWTKHQVVQGHTMQAISVEQVSAAYDYIYSAATELSSKDIERSNLCGG